MLRHPDSFPGLNLAGAGIELDENLEPEFIAGGFNSSAWMVGNQVLKVTSQTKDERGARELRDTMRREHDTIKPYIGAHMVETDYSLVEETSGEGFRVLTTQPFVEGTSLVDFFDQPDANVEPFIGFLEKSRLAYKETGIMPDISCIEKFFWPLRDSNTLILEDQGDHPMLVDTTSGKTQRQQNFIGMAWNKFIYTGAGRAINYLSWRLHETEVGNDAGPVQAEEF